MKLRKLGVVMPAIFLLAGCVNLAPKNEKPIVDNIFFESVDEEAKVILTSWEDYIVSDNLKSIILSAIKNNHDIDIARSNIELAIESYNISKTDKLPKVDLGLVTSKGESIKKTESITADIGFNSYEIDFFGKVSNRNKSALREYEAIVAESRFITKTIVNKTLHILNAIASNNEMISKLESIAVNSLESEDIISKKVEFGISKESDLSNAKTVTLRARYDIEIAKNDLFRNTTALSIITGEITDFDKLPKSLSEIRDGMRILDINTDSRNMLSRPDIVMIERKLEAADANIGVARANFYPSVKITTSAGVISTDFQSLSSNGTWLIKPSIEIPIFNSGLNKSRLKASKIERRKLVAEYKKVVEGAFKEVADNINERESIEKQISVFTELLMESNKSFKLSEDAYKEGIADFLDILNLKKDLYKTEKEFINLKAKEYENLINLYQSISIY